LLDEPLSVIGFHKNIKEYYFFNCLRQEIVKWAYTLDHPKCAVEARYKLYYYLQDPEKYP